MFQGAITALATPFKDGQIDYHSFNKFLDFQINSEIDGVVVAGSTGEAATLSSEEKIELTKRALAFVDGKIPVILGTGSNNTKATVDLTKKAKEIGVDGVLIVAPYYNKPTQEGLYQHFSTVANEVDIPIILYNVPSRTASTIALTTVTRLAEISNVVAIKEASGNLNNVTEILRLCDDSITVLSGEDALTYPMICLGGKGVISTTSNVAPKDFHDLCLSALAGNHEKARALHFKTYPLIQAMFVETNPIPVKFALKLMALMDGEIRLPLTPPSETSQEKIKKVLDNYGGLLI